MQSECNLQSAVCNLLSAICSLQSAVCKRQTTVTEDLNSGLPRNKSCWSQGGGLVPGTSGLQYLRSKPLGHAASSGIIQLSVSPIQTLLYYVLIEKFTFLFIKFAFRYLQQNLLEELPDNVFFALSKLKVL